MPNNILVFISLTWVQKMMALKVSTSRASGMKPHSRIRAPDLGLRLRTTVSWRVPKWELCSLGDVSREAITSLEDEQAQSPEIGQSQMAHHRYSTTHHSYKDLDCITKPLSCDDLSSSGNSQLLIAFRGNPGSYNEVAALTLYPDCSAIACEEYEDVFEAVETFSVNKAVLPIESSVYGSWHQNYDLLLRHKLHITGEVQIAINHCLLALPGVRKEELKRVMSHPQAFINSEKTLSNLRLARLEAADTAKAAQIVADLGERDLAAISSSRAAKVYELDILAEQFQDYDVNITRFLFLERDPVLPTITRRHKTSIVFSVENGIGSLFRALGAFAMRNISLLKIESRPQVKSPGPLVDESKRKCFDYLFYIDVDASLAETQMQNAMFSMQEFTTFFHVLGCYPV